MYIVNERRTNVTKNMLQSNDASNVHCFKSALIIRTKKLEKVQIGEYPVHVVFFAYMKYDMQQPMAKWSSMVCWHY
jgi:hypothetical protein